MTPTSIRFPGTLGVLSITWPGGRFVLHTRGLCGPIECNDVSTAMAILNWYLAGDYLEDL